LFLRALDDFDLALHESPSDRSASTEAIRIQIRDVLEALDKYSKHCSSLLESIRRDHSFYVMLIVCLFDSCSILRIVPPTGMPKDVTAGEGSSGEALSDKGQKGTSKPSNNSQVEKYQENRGGWNMWLLLIIVCFLASLIFIVVPSSRKTVS
jgi:hypothetical protein